MNAQELLMGILNQYKAEFPDSDKIYVVLPATIFDGIEASFRPIERIATNDPAAELARFHHTDGVTYNLFRTTQGVKVSMYNELEFHSYVRKMMKLFGL